MKSVFFGDGSRLGTVLLFCACFGLAAPGVFGQAGTLSVERQEWLSQTGEGTPVPLYYRFDSEVLGAGLQEVTLTSPATTAELTGTTSTQVSFAKNYPVVNQELENGLDNLNAEFPLGDYSLFVRSSVTVGMMTIEQENTFNFSLSTDFPDTQPIITNIPALSPLSETQTFEWNSFGGDDDDSISFTLLEGTFSAELLEGVANGTTELTDALTVLSFQPGFSADTTSTEVSGIDVFQDHLVVLRFSDVQADQTGIAAESVGASIGNIILFVRAVAVSFAADLEDKSAITGQTVTFVATAVGSTPLSYQWLKDGAEISGATGVTLQLENVQPENAGDYSVRVSNEFSEATSNAATLTVTTVDSYENWQTVHFDSAELMNAEISGTDADPDGDGVVNWLEYAFDLDPKTPDAEGVPKLSSSEGEGGGLTLEYVFTQIKDTTDLTYSVETSSSLGGWVELSAEAEGVTVQNADIDEFKRSVTYSYTLPSETTEVFLRLSVD